MTWFEHLLDWHERRREKRHCAHLRRSGIYGDRINHVGGWRLKCIDCGRYLAGPVTAANVNRDPLGYDPMVSGVFADWDDFADWESFHGPCPEGRWVIGYQSYRVRDGKATPIHAP